MNTSQDATSIAAIDRVLAADPRNVRALIAKADHFAAAGDQRSASAFYLAALRAAPPPDKLPPELVPHLRRAQETCARHAREYKEYLRSRLVNKGFDAPEHGRFAQALDIVFGEKRIFVQEPRYFYFWKNGEPVHENMARCPSVMRALRNAPLPQVPYRSPVVLFSLLKPGTHIPPHNGLVNTRLIGHLPLIVPGQPGQCRLRVGNDTRPWVEGKAWAFDDSIDHEAWNDSDETRVILLFDIWRPEISAVEQALVTELFAAIDAYSGTQPDWET